MLTGVVRASVRRARAILSTFSIPRRDAVHHRRTLIVWLALCLVAAAVAGVLALDPLVLHGFAPACSDGYAEAYGIAPCEPDWGHGAPYLLALGVALAGATVSSALLVRGGRLRRPT